MRRVLVLAVVLGVLAVLSTRIDLDALEGEVRGRLGAGEAERTRATVLAVRDGDTIRVRITGTGAEEEVRLLGIDTPEVRDEAECGGRAATTSLVVMTPVGSKVTLVSDPSQGDRDRYDRLLRYVVGDGEDVGLTQLQTGLAKVFVFEDDPFDRVDAYRRAQRGARTQALGLWAACWR